MVRLTTLQLPYQSSPDTLAAYILWLLEQQAILCAGGRPLDHVSATGKQGLTLEEAFWAQGP